MDQMSGPYTEYWIAGKTNREPALGPVNMEDIQTGRIAGKTDREPALGPVNIGIQLLDRSTWKTFNQVGVIIKNQSWHSQQSHDHWRLR